MTTTYGGSNVLGVNTRKVHRNPGTLSIDMNNLAVHIDDVPEYEYEAISIVYIHSNEVGSDESEKMREFDRGHPVQAAVLPDPCEHYGPYTELDIYVMGELDIESKEDVLDVIVRSKLSELYSL